jgi:hypothetical protein
MILQNVKISRRVLFGAPRRGLEPMGREAFEEPSIMTL